MFRHNDAKPHRTVNWTAVAILSVYSIAVVVAVTKTAQSYRLLGYYRETPWAAWVEAIVMALFVELAPLAFDFAAAEKYGDEPTGWNRLWKKLMELSGATIAIGVTLLLNKVLSEHMVSIWDFGALVGEQANLATAMSADLGSNVLAPVVTVMVRTWRAKQERAQEAQQVEAKVEAKEADALQFERARILAADEFQREMARTKQADRHEERMARSAQVVRPRSSAERPPNERPDEAERRARIVAHLNEHGRSHVNELIEQANAGRTTVYADLRALDELGQVVQAGRGWYAPRNGHQGE